MSSIIAARLLGRQTFGQFALVLSTVIALTSVAGLGLGTTATKYVSEYRSSDPLRVGRILGLSSIVALLAALSFSAMLLLAAPWLAVGADPGGALSGAFRLSGIYVFFITLNGYQLGALVGFESFRAVARINILYGIGNVAATSALTVWMGLQGAVIANCAGAFFLWALYHHGIAAECRRRNIRIAFRGAWHERRILMHFSLPSAACGTIAPFAIWWSNTILARNSGYTELAVFTAAGNMRSLVLLLPGLVNRVIGPTLNHIRASGEFREYSRIFWGATAMNTATAVGIASLLLVRGQELLRVFGKEFAAPRFMIPLLLGSVVLEVVANNLYHALFTAGELWRNLTIFTIWSAVLVGIMSLVAPRYGATGLALSYLAAWSVSLVLYGLAYRKQKRRRIAYD